MVCNQCNRPAMYQLNNGLYLCLDCYSKLVKVTEIQNAESERAINFLLGEMEMVTGIPMPNRFPARKPVVIQNSPIINAKDNRIIIDRSVVGSVNTGYISQLENNISNIGSHDGAEALKKFTEAFLSANSFTNNQKDEILQQLNFLSQQLQQKKEARNTAVIKIIAMTIARTISISADLLTLWEPVKRLLNIS